MDNLTPSVPMIAKLLNVNGYHKRFEEVLTTYPGMIAKPFLYNSGTPQNHYNPDEMVKAFHEIYAKHLNREEVLDLIAFYKTPAGQKLAATDEKIRAELHQATIKMAIEIAAKIVKDNTRPPPEDPNLPF